MGDAILPHDRQSITPTHIKQLFQAIDAHFWDTTVQRTRLKLEWDLFLTIQMHPQDIGMSHADYPSGDFS